jgi:hypothetical protein
MVRMTHHAIHAEIVADDSRIFAAQAGDGGEVSGW